ncbi:uncharacterized protein YeaO (DUF488 family) [Luteibacter sp. OK325]|uniref:DUF488 domain-containing protein n=1 Tax=Luteibacter sp. OK325 TaxID=2135670 RepID=UPI000D381B32|nr:DUF488 domain-containing protein [Luteibacter sp. OK325]PTR30785.1 uncharacterized protein YeaO (DUF488 family) [Luteibacter sp. OK325]
MPTLSVKRVYEEPSPRDGMRVLVDRLWPRGLTKEKAAVDLWLKKIAPSPTLRTWFDHREDRFEAFAEKYRNELEHNPAVAELRALVKKRKVTLVYGAHDTAINHAVVLEAWLGT